VYLNDALNNYQSVAQQMLQSDELHVHCMYLYVLDCKHLSDQQQSACHDDVPRAIRLCTSNAYN
jgi:hypothetical protein